MSRSARLFIRGFRRGRAALAGAFSAFTLSAAAQPAFAPYEVIPTGSWASAVATGDLNGDRRTDVAIATEAFFDSPNDYKILVFLQNESGELALSARYSGGTGRSVAIADVNGDGLNDVITPTTNGLGVLTQNENGRLNPLVIYADANASLRVATGDLNHDGLEDVAAIAWGSDQVSVFLQRPDGTLAAPARYNAPHDGYDDLEVGDVTDDGRDDVVVMSGQGYATPNFSVLAQRPEGGFYPVESYRIGEQVLANSLAIGRIDGDERNDVAVSFRASGNGISAFTQDADARLVRAANISPRSVDTMRFGDADGDDLPDLIGAGDGTKLNVFPRSSAGGFGAPQTFTLPYATSLNPHGLALGDIDNDGDTDVVTANYGSGLVINRNTASASPLPSPAPLPADATIGFSLRRRYGEPKTFFAVSPPDFGYAITYWLNGQGVYLSKGGASWEVTLKAAGGADLAAGRYSGVSSAETGDHAQLVLKNGGVPLEYDHATVEVTEARQAGYYIDRLHYRFTLFDAAQRTIAVGEVQLRDLPNPPPTPTPTPTPAPTATPLPAATPRPTPDRTDRTVPRIRVLGASVRRTNLPFIFLRGTAADNRRLNRVEIHQTGDRPRRARGKPSRWFDFAKLGPGRNVFSIRATDAAGNRSRPQRVTVIYELGAPVGGR